MHPQLTTVAIPVDEIARRVVARVLRQLDHGPDQEPGEVVPARLQLGESTGRAGHQAVRDRWPGGRPGARDGAAEAGEDAVPSWKRFQGATLANGTPPAQRGPAGDDRGRGRRRRVGVGTVSRVLNGSGQVRESTLRTRARLDRPARLPAQPRRRRPGPGHSEHRGAPRRPPDQAVDRRPGGERAGGPGSGGLRHDRLQRGQPGGTRPAPGEPAAHPPGRRVPGHLPAALQRPARPVRPGRSRPGQRRRGQPRGAADGHRRRGGRSAGDRSPHRARAPPDRLRRRHDVRPPPGRAWLHLLGAPAARVPAGPGRGGHRPGARPDQARPARRRGRGRPGRGAAEVAHPRRRSSPRPTPRPSACWPPRTSSACRFPDGSR